MDSVLLSGIILFYLGYYYIWHTRFYRILRSSKKSNFTVYWFTRRSWYSYLLWRWLFWSNVEVNTIKTKWNTDESTLTVNNWIRIKRVEGTNGYINYMAIERIRTAKPYCLPYCLQMNNQTATLSVVRYQVDLCSTIRK